MYKRKLPIRKPPIPEKNVRVIKISKDAIFEFIENMTKTLTPGACGMDKKRLKCYTSLGFHTA